MTDSTKSPSEPIRDIARRYAYVRVTNWANVDGKVTEVCGGVELRDGEQCNVMYGNVGMLMSDTFAHVNFVDDLSVARAFEERVRACWPGRSYFCEVGVDDRYTQVFQPGDGDWLSGTGERA